MLARRTHRFDATKGRTESVHPFISELGSTVD